MFYQTISYLISAVSYNDNHIAKVKVHTTDDPNASMIYTRQQVLDAMKNGYSFHTATEKWGKLQKGAKVEKVTIDWVDYIRTDSNKVKKDNLGELPTF